MDMARWRYLQAGIEAAIAQLPGRAAVVIRRPTDGLNVAWNEDALFPAASLVKLAVMWALFRLAPAIGLNVHERVRVWPEERVGGSGVLVTLSEMLELSWIDLATLMIVVSDNSATNKLIDRLGMEAVNGELEGLGLRQTRLQRKMMDFERARLGFENVTTAAEMAVLLAQILATGAPVGERMLAMLKGQQLNDRLSRAWPEEVTFAHKTGSLPGLAEHDAGILLGHGEPLIVVALSSDLARNSDGAEFCATVGRLALEWANGAGRKSAG
jgi:beta-lactamase class A